MAEVSLALRFLEESLVRNAAGKAFQAWRAYLAVLLRLELDKLLQKAKTEEVAYGEGGVESTHHEGG